MNNELERRIFLLRQEVLRPSVDLQLKENEIDSHATAPLIVDALRLFIDPTASTFYLRAYHRGQWKQISSDDLIGPISEFVTNKIAVYKAPAGYCKMLDSANLLIYKPILHFRKPPTLWLADFSITGYVRLGSGKAVYSDGTWSFTQTHRHGTETAHLYLKQANIS